ncbi:MAG: XRE family transcriptional regulator [Methanobacterium sp.]
MVYRVNANPKMIRWARKDAGYKIEELPKYLENVPKWESGELQPTWEDLRKLAKKYKRPPVFYLRSEPPEIKKDNIEEFRSAERVAEKSPELRLEIRKAKYRRNAFVNLHKEMGINLSNFSKNTIDTKNIKDFAEKIREILDVSIDTQKEWIFNKNCKKQYNHSVFLDQWKELVSYLGVLIFETEDVTEEEMSGLSLYYDNYPLILLNGKNTHNRRIFTLIHELAHLMKVESTICDVDKYNKKEAFCNKVAAEVLVPSEILNKTPLTTKTTVNDHESYEWTNRELSKLAHIFGVSKQTILLKLYDNKKTTIAFKNSMIKDLEEENEEFRRKKEERNKNSSGGGMSSIEKAKKYEGKTYSRFIINAYENNVISSVTFMRYLNVSIDNIDALFDEVGY